MFSGRSVASMRVVSMVEYRYSGPVPASKSLYNRALIVKSYFPVLELFGESRCDDVQCMRSALSEIKDRSHIQCGDGGTTFRFMALRVSRNPGVHSVEGSERLLQRPQGELVEILQQLGVQAQLKRNGLFMISEGWKKPRKPVVVNCSESSQFASALALNSWLLDFDLNVELVGGKLSAGYLGLTLEMLARMGMRFRKTPRGYLFKAGERLEQLQWKVEADVSSAFTIAVLGALCGEVHIENFPNNSLQPDIIFLEIFRKMRVRFQQKENLLSVSKTTGLQAVDWDISQCPDLFPVLSVLCSQASGTSRLYGAPHLTKKESNRIRKVADLLNLVGVKYEVLDDGMVIHGQGPSSQLGRGRFNPDKDHRMVMAAMVFKMLGHHLHIEDVSVINKSFPEFWEILGRKP